MTEQLQQLEKNWKVAAVFVVTGLFIGMLLTLQFRSSIPPSTFLSDQLRAQEYLVDSYLQDQSLLKSKIVALRQQIELAQEEAQGHLQAGNLETLKELKKEIGLDSVRGPGIEIVLQDGLFVDRESPDTVRQSLIHASDLRDTVNVLRASGATAIAINDQRIIASTPITSVGNTILVNNFHLLPPFTISAIGDTELIVARLNDPSSLPDLQKRVQDLNVQFQAQAKAGLLIAEYTGNLSAKFITEFSLSEI